LELKPLSPTAKAPAQNFTGDVYVNQIKTPDEPSRLIVGYVRFAPGARTNWHSHALGQTLYCTDGIGLVVTRDGAVIRMRSGDTVWTPPGEEHWHGATPGNMMCTSPCSKATAPATAPHGSSPSPRSNTRPLTCSDGSGRRESDPHDQLGRLRRAVLRTAAA
jgi:quercetin dioxygenase-like cupin family protein